MPNSLNDFLKDHAQLGIVFVGLLILNMFINVMTYIDFLGMNKIKFYIDVYFMWISGFILLIVFLKPWNPSGISNISESNKSSGGNVSVSMKKFEFRFS